MDLLPPRERVALVSLWERLKKQMPSVAPVAVQFDIENSFETEFSAKTFDLTTFIDSNWDWGLSVREALNNLRSRPTHA
jgi:hypothetical protein